MIQAHGRGNELPLGGQAGSPPGPVQSVARLLDHKVAATGLEHGPRRLARDRAVVTGLLQDHQQGGDIDTTVLDDRQKPRFVVQLGDGHARGHLGHLHGDDLAGRNFPDRLQGPARGENVPNVDQQTDIGGGHHVQQEHQGVEIVDELEGLILPQGLQGQEPDPEPGAGRLQGLANLLESPPVEFEVLVIRAFVASGGQRGDAACAAHRGGRLGKFRQLRQLLLIGLFVGIPVQGKLKSALSQLRAIDQPPGVIQALQSRPRRKIRHVQVHSPKAESEGQLDEFALMTGNSEG